MKYNLVFFLRKASIITKEAKDDGTLRTIDVEGVERYKYESADDFKRFFEALKTDIYNIQDFDEDEFYVTVLDMGVQKEVSARFKEHLEGCSAVCVLSRETFQSLMEGIQDASEIEELKKRILEKEEENKSLEKRLEEAVKESEEGGGLKETFMSALFPVGDGGKSVSTSINATIIGKRFKNGDEVKKGDVIAVAEFKNVKFNIASPSDGYVFFQNDDNDLSMGKIIAFVRERRYAHVKNLFALDNGDEMPDLPYDKEIHLEQTNLEIDWSWGEYKGTFLFALSINNQPSFYRGDFTSQEEELAEKYVRQIISCVVDIMRKSYHLNDTKKIFFVIPCMEPGAPLQEYKKIAELVTEYEK